MHDSEVPRQFILRVPLTKIEFHALVYGIAPETSWWCFECEDEDRYDLDAATNAAYDSGFEAGYRKAEREVPHRAVDLGGRNIRDW